MNYPPRFGHLATRPVVVSKLLTTFAQLHEIDEDEAASRLTRALEGPLLSALLESAWAALLGKAKRLDDAGLVEKVARSLQDRPTRPGRAMPQSPALSAFWVQVDLAAGTASEAIRRAMENPQAQKMATAGMVEAGAFLAAELTR